MPAIGQANNLIKVKVSCECNESHDEFDDYDDGETTKKDAPDGPNEPLVIMQNHATGSRIISFTLLCILTIWFTLAFWLIANPPSGYCKSYCTEILYNPTDDENCELAILKLEKDLEKFHELTSLYGRYFNVSDRRIDNSLQDAYLWFIVYRLVGNGDLTEIDKAYIRKQYFQYDIFNKYYELRKATKRIATYMPKSLHSLFGIKESYDSKISNYGINEYYAEKKHAAPKDQEVILPTPRISDDKRYALYDKIFCGEKFREVSNNSEVTLTTQSSIDRLMSFTTSASNWGGPVSLAVFLNGSDDYCLFMKYFHYLENCRREIYDRTCFSVAFPVNNRPNGDGSRCTVNSCSPPDVFNPNVKNSSKILKPPTEYPQNTMRNLAIANILTRYRLMLDIDIIPSPKMSPALSKFLKGKNIKNGLVVPTYEISRKAKFPVNKAELVGLTRKNSAHPFHRFIFSLNQNATDFPRWEKLHDTYKDVDIAYEIPKFPLYYEPFFVHHSNGTMYDENFIGYGFTRSSHAIETYMQDGNFKVLSPVFNVAIGIQRFKDWSPDRRIQNDANQEIFQKYLENLRIRNATITESFLTLPGP